MKNNTDNVTTPEIALFDIDGVVVPEGEMYFGGRLRQELDIPQEEIQDFFRGGFIECLRGNADLQEELAWCIEEWGWPGSVEDILSFWFEVERYINPHVISLIESLTDRQVSCYIASNQERYRAEFLWEEVGLKNHLEDAFFSYEVGALKNKRRYFSYVLNHLKDTPPEDIVFWDNVQEYVDTAQEAGIEGRLYTSQEDLREYVDSLDMPESKSNSLAVAINSIYTLTDHLFSTKPDRIHYLHDGNTNNVYSAEVGEEEIMIKFNEEQSRARLFQWQKNTFDKLRETSVPVPQVISVGSDIISRAYMVYSKLPGRSMETYMSDTKTLWHKLGRYMKEVHSVSVSRYGRIQYWDDEAGALEESWKPHIKREIKRAVDPPFTSKRCAFIDENEDKIKDRLEEMLGWEFSPSIIHGDLMPENILINAKGEITGIIDWGEMVWAKAPEWELAAILSWRHHSPDSPFYISQKAIEAFLEGYGITRDEYDAMLHDIETIQLFRYCEYGNYFLHIGDQDRVEDASDRALSILGKD